MAFDQDKFIEKVKKNLETTSNLMVCISEGINDGKGTFICEHASEVGTDNFGHKMLTGSGKYLENLVKAKLGVKVRSIELNVCQRCSSAHLSSVDLTEAVNAGIYSVHAALAGKTGKMITFVRSAVFLMNYPMGPTDVNLICNEEKPVPTEWITEDGSDIGEAFLEYARPLIQGHVELPTKDGVPVFAYRK